MSRVPTYHMLIDWFGHGGLSMPLQGWEEDGSTLEVSTEQAFFGDESLKVTWTPGVLTRRTFRWLNTPSVSVALEVRAWIYVASDSDAVDVQLWVGGVKVDSSLVEDRDTWVEVSLATPATTEPRVEVVVTPSDDPGNLAMIFDDTSTGWGTGVFGTDSDGIVDNAFRFDSSVYGWDNGVFAQGTSVYIGGVRLLSEQDDVSCKILATREVPDVEYGRDAARDLESMKPGEMSFQLNNADGLYTPDNPSSALGLYVGPNKPVWYYAQYNQRGYTLFNGNLNAYAINAAHNERSVALSAVDQIARLAETTVHTGVYPSIRVGDAVNVVLDAVGFTGPRDIDNGASVLRWWGRGGVNAKEVLDDLMIVEGPPALYHMTDGGGFVFRDRNHRLIRPRSTTPQVTLASCEVDSSMTFLDDSDIDYGWSDVINAVEAAATITRPSGELASVWKSEDDYVIPVGETVTLQGSVDGGYVDAIDPVGAEPVVVHNDGPDVQDVTTGVPEGDYDYVIRTGTVEVSTTYTAGTRVEITVENTGADVARIEGMQLRGKPIESEDHGREIVDEHSVTLYGSKSSYSIDMPGVTDGDVEAVASKILATRSLRRPTFTLSLLNTSEDMTTEILERNFSDRITVVSDEWAVNTDAYVEAIGHSPDALGRQHGASYVCEAEPSPTYSNAFTFGLDTKGFDESVYQSNTLVTPDNVFRLGMSTLNSADKLAY